MNSGDYKVISVLINAFLGPVSLRYYLNYGYRETVLNESLFLYSLLWWIYYIIYTFPYFFKLYYGEVFFYWILFWIIIILISFIINKTHIYSRLEKSVKISGDVRNEIEKASNNFFVFWFPVGCLIYFGYALARSFDSNLIYYIFLWWLIWFVIWVFRLLIVIYFGKFMIYAISTLYRKRKKSVINHISFISIYSCVYAFSFIISFMKFFSLFFLIGFYVKKGNYLNLF